MIKSFAGVLGISVGIFCGLKKLKGYTDFKPEDIDFQEFTEQVRKKDEMFTKAINQVLREISDN